MVKRYDLTFGENDNLIDDYVDGKYVLYSEHVTEMREILEWVNNIIKDPMITPRIQQTWKANDILAKYRHYLDGTND